MDIGPLKQRWMCLFQQVADASYLSTNFDKLVEHYTEPHRYYHTPRHIAMCLHGFDQVKNQVSDPFCVECALWFHDIIYNPKKQNNEYLSARYARSFLAQTTITEEQIEKIKHLIELTQHPACPKTDDEKYLVDIDLMILGSEPKIYAQYEQWIRKEYAFVPNFFYKRGRKKLLTSFIKQNSIYSTYFFRKQLEKQARENLEQALNHL